MPGTWMRVSGRARQVPCDTGHFVRSSLSFAASVQWCVLNVVDTYEKLFIS